MIYIERKVINGVENLLVGNEYDSKPIYNKNKPCIIDRLFRILCELSDHNLKLCNDLCRNRIKEYDLIYLANILILMKPSMLKNDTYCEVLCISEDFLYIRRSDNEIFEVFLDHILHKIKVYDKLFCIYK